ncbi:choice-of-anchor D domain-containing protein [Micromonospora sp. KC723]|uniref:choice-of-anchor D domain-containing protein n=1 Tax=Micromonospora sp. KC723 TaxID=2530381 RepID=UPI00104EAE01|nr:choice-of-anchor D domain-containing protein [Micromonospora sp. KC723]TDB71300.1 choice-of-anchor D domain-containing protein [Micromonospora sp. KC723]
MTVRYVALDGSGEVCTQAQPCGRIAKALGIAGSGDSIMVGPGTYVENLEVPSGLAVTIIGAGSGATVINGNRVGSVISVPSTSNVTLTGMGLTNGAAVAGGGGIGNLGTIRLERVNVGFSTAHNGGGIANFGTATIADSSILFNTARAFGGGIYNTGTLTVLRSTIAGNSVTGTGSLGGGGAMAGYGRVELHDSTLSGNTAAGGRGSAVLLPGISPVPSSFNGVHNTIVNNTGTAFEAYGTQPVVTLAASIVGGHSTNCRDVTIQGRYNLMDSASSCGPDPANGDVVGNPQVGDLTDNGGPTPTRALAATSPARNAVPAASGLCGGTDQRGATRLFLYAGSCDIGAYQYAASPPKVHLEPAGGVHFGDQILGSTTTRTVTVRNTGGRPLGVARISVAGTGFALTSTTCQAAGVPVPLASGADCTISVSFAPAAAGARQGTLTLADNDGDTQDPAGATQTVPLSGTGRGAVPVATIPPSSTGSTRVGGVLTGQPGSWTGDPTSYAYQWQRCTSQGTGCTAIGGATATTYQLTGTDVGSRVRVQVIASNTHGAGAPAISRATAVVFQPSRPVGGVLTRRPGS